MKRKLLWGFLAIVALAVLWGLAFAPVSVDPISEAITKAFSETKQVAIAAKLYADDHQGRLPNSLDDLAPTYLLDKRFFAHTHLTMPHALLAELPLEAIILFRVDTDDRRHPTRVLVVHPDMSVEWKRP